MFITSCVALFVQVMVVIGMALWPEVLEERVLAIIAATLLFFHIAYLAAAAVRRLFPAMAVGSLTLMILLAVVLAGDSLLVAVNAFGVIAGTIAMVGASGLVGRSGAGQAGGLWSCNRWPELSLRVLGGLAFASFVVAAVGSFSHQIEPGLALGMAFMGLFSMLNFVTFFGVLALSLRGRRGFVLAVSVVLLTVVGVVVVVASGGQGAGYFALVSVAVLIAMVLRPLG